jgi:hypothetical protein
MQRSLTGVYAVAIPLKRKSRQMDSRFDPYMICWSSAAHEIGREPTPEELAEKLGMPLEKVRKVLKMAKEPILLATLIGDDDIVFRIDLRLVGGSIFPIARRMIVAWRRPCPGVEVAALSA